MPPPTTAADRLDPALDVIFALIKDRRTGPARVRLVDYLKLHPDDGQAVFLFGLTYHREQKYGQAVPYFEKALALATQYRPINHFLGWALYYLGRLPESRQAFEAFLRLQPDEPDSHFAIGLIDLDEDRLDDAQQRFERSIQLLQTQGDKADAKAVSKAHTRLGEALERRGDLPSARQHLQTAADLYPDHYEALYKLYRVLLRLGETEKAQAVHEQYLAAKERVRPGTSFPE